MLVYVVFEKQWKAHVEEPSGEAVAMAAAAQYLDKDRQRINLLQDIINTGSSPAFSGRTPEIKVPSPPSRPHDD